MRIRKRWPLTAHLPPLTSSIPNRPPTTAPNPDHQNQHRVQHEVVDEEEEGDYEGKKGFLLRGERGGGGGGGGRRRRRRGLMLPLHPNGDSQLLHDRVLHRPSSDLHPTLLMGKRNGWIRADEGSVSLLPQSWKGKEEEEGGGDDCNEEREDNVENWVDVEKRSSYGVRTGNNMSSSVERAARLVLPPFSSSHQGERVSSYKKKRGGRGEHGEDGMRLKKMTHNFAEDDDDDDDQDKDVVIREGTHVEGETKKKGRGINSSAAHDAVAMEGSRCSRVNGRGWRCSQQTLVGYALCEHHLGKGRLRSISSVRSRLPLPTAIATKKNINHVVAGESNSSSSNNNNNSVLSLSLALQDHEALGEEEDDHNDYYCKDHEDQVEKEISAAPALAKKRKKIGMVKARSINSLLDQTHRATYTVRPSQSQHLV